MGEDVILCEICKREIDKKKDNYVRITDYNQGEFYEEKFYHTMCFSNKMQTVTDSKSNQSLARKMLMKLDKIVTDRTGIEDVVEIK